MAKVMKTRGRKSGTPPKISATLGEAINVALGELGGVDYLVKIGRDEPRTFCALLGRTLQGESKVPDDEPKNNVLVVVPGKLTAEDWTARVAEAVREHDAQQ